MSPSEKVEWDDVQRLVLSGYGELPYSAYLLWRFSSANGRARKDWLASLSSRLRRANAEGEDDAPDAAEGKSNGGPRVQRAINLALTARGLERLEIGKAALDGFASEFLEGMSPHPSAGAQASRRSNVLGDLGASSPQYWEWGGWKKNEDIDGLLLLFAADQTTLQQLINDEMRAMDGVAVPIPIQLRGHIDKDKDFKEQFGFTDGISQPIIEGRPRSRRHRHAKRVQDHVSTVKPGEFVLGYVNERRVCVGPEPQANGDAAKDLRRNGTYLVFRQLAQDVAAFEKFVASFAAFVGEDEDWVRARLLGRAADGQPLVRSVGCPSGGDPRNDFLFHHEDRFGLACPIGAHIRRANPRDSLGPDPETALRLSKMHRIIRRGRPYGTRWEAGQQDGDKTERGMLFIALNADIAGQFEMIQHSWLNNPHFAGLNSGTDPLGHYVEDGEHITIQRRPTNLHIKRPPPFVTVRGGAYFFLPGIRALRQMAAA